MLFATDPWHPLLDWLSKQSQPVVLEIACAADPEPGRGRRGPNVVQLPDCIADLPHHVALEALTTGASQLRFRVFGCTNPEESRENIGQITKLLRFAGRTEQLAVEDERATGFLVPRKRPVMQAASRQLARRSLFGIPGALPPVRDLPEEEQTEHRRLIAALRSLASPPAPVHAETPGPGWRLEVGDCVSCAVCVRACDDRALSLEGGTEDQNGDRQDALVQNPARCSGCGECVRLCPEQVITHVGNYPWATVFADTEMLLAEVPTSRCSKCGDRYRQTGSPLCLLCARRAANPLATPLPPEVAAKLPPEVVARLREHGM